MQFREIRQTQTLAFSASASVQMNINYQSFWITYMVLDFQLTETQSAATPNQDWFARAITSMTLSAGGDPYLAIASPDLRPLYWLVRCLAGGGKRGPDWVGAHNGTPVWQLIIPFGFHPFTYEGKLNRRDVTAAIEPNAALTFGVTWGGATSMGTGITLGAAANIGVTLGGFIPEPGDALPTYRPLWYTKQPTIVGSSGLGMTSPLDLQRIFRRSLIMQTNGASPSDNRTDADVTEVGIVDGASKRLAYWKSYDLAEQSQAAFQVADDNTGQVGATFAAGTSVSTVAYNPGVYFVDWMDVKPSSDKGPDAAAGASTINAAPNALNLAYTVTTTTNTALTELHAAYVRR